MLPPTSMLQMEQNGEFSSSVHQRQKREPIVPACEFTHATAAAVPDQAARPGGLGAPALTPAGASQPSLPTFADCLTWYPLA